MLLGTVLQGRRYSAAEYSAAALLVAGISLFTLGALSALIRHFIHTHMLSLTHTHTHLFDAA